jgi:hypothetical protein
MNYLKHYIKLVRKAKRFNRTRFDGGYYEAHHVKPNSLGGKRLVLLTAKEHYIAHFLLYKHYKKFGNSNQRIKMSEAFHAMTFSSSDNIERYNSKTFSIARKAKSEAMKGEGNPMYGLKRPECSKRIGKGVDNIANREDVKAKLRKAWANKPLIVCPHCDKSSKNKGNMTRHHFDHCKENPNRIINEKLEKTYLKISHSLSKQSI